MKFREKKIDICVDIFFVSFTKFKGIQGLYTKFQVISRVQRTKINSRLFKNSKEPWEPWRLMSQGQSLKIVKKKYQTILSTDCAHNFETAKSWFWENRQRKAKISWALSKMGTRLYFRYYPYLALKWWKLYLRDTFTTNMINLQFKIDIKPKIKNFTISWHLLTLGALYLFLQILQWISHSDCCSTFMC